MRTQQLTPPSLSNRSDTHGPISEPSPSLGLNAFATIDSIGLPSSTFFANEGDSSFDWIFQNMTQSCDWPALNLPSEHPFTEQLSSSPTWPYTPSVSHNAQDPPGKFRTNPGQQENWLLEDPDSGRHLLCIPEFGKEFDNLSQNGSYCQLTKIDETKREKIQQSVNSFLEKTPWMPTSLANFPSREKLDYCIDLFFANFHPVSTVHSVSVSIDSFLNKIVGIELYSSTDFQSCHDAGFAYSRNSQHRSTIHKSQRRDIFCQRDC